MVAVVHFIIVGLVLVNKGVNPMVSSKALEGYPMGYLGNCPGSTKPAIIMKKSMKYLGILVVGPGGRKTKYGYHQAKNIAKHPAIDFKKRDTVMFIGGFMDSPNFFPSATMGNEYQKRGYNVLIMEANRFLTMHYPISARYMRPIGKILAEMLSNLTDSGLDPKRFHLIGVSLGGQTVSYIAKNFYRITGQKVARITALDPSGPCFRNLGPEDRLDQSDADFVDVIQTNIDGFGMAAPVGHVNIYVNGGEYQPGDVYWMPCSTLCSHVRVYTLWISALYHPDKFIAIKCDSVQQARNLSCYDHQPMETNIMGMKADRSKPGIYYLATGNNYPYFLGKDGMRKENEFWGKNLGEFNSDDVMKMK